MDLAASIQAVTRGGGAAADAQPREPRPARRNLCLAGGVALNCVANGKVLRDGKFDDIWIQPAAGDAGGAVGAALAAYHQLQGPAAQASTAATACRRLSRARASRKPRSSGGSTAAGARFTVLDDDAMIERTGAGARRSAGGRLVPGPHGVRPARARRPLDPRRPALADHAEEPQSQGQVPRELPALRARGAARGRRRLVRARRRQPLHAARRRRPRGPAPRHDRGRAGAVRHRQAQRAALGNSGGDPRRLFGAHPDRARATPIRGSTGCSRASSS